MSYNRFRYTRIDGLTITVTGAIQWSQTESALTILVTLMHNVDSDNTGRIAGKVTVVHGGLFGITMAFH